MKSILVNLVGVAALTWATSPVLAADPPRTGSVQQPSLDDELLKGLGDGSTEDLKGQPPAKPADHAATPAPDKSAKPNSPLDEQLRKSLGGEDIGQPGEDSGDNRLAKIAQRMKAVEQRLAQSQADAATQQEQQQIAAELAALLEDLMKHRQEMKSSKSSSQQANSTRPKPSQQQNDPGKSASNTPNPHPKDSSNQLRPNQTTRPDAAAVQNAMRKALDRLNLPEKQREQMLEAPPDDFLPSYEFTIKRYFERLVEEEGDK